jgi:hypothetical protein
VGKVKDPKVGATLIYFETSGVQDFETPEVWNIVSRVSQKARRPKSRGNILESVRSSRIQDSRGHTCIKEKGRSMLKHRMLDSPLACVLDED